MKPVAAAILTAALTVALVPASSALTYSEQPLPRVGDHDPNDLRMQGAVPWDMLRELDLAYETKGPGMTSFTTSFTTELEQLEGKEVKRA